MPTVPRPAIVIPGIEGSALQNTYPLTPAATWSTFYAAESTFIAPNFNSLALTDDARADRSDNVLTRAVQLLEIAYSKVVEGLQGRNQVPAYLFPYDWRYSCRVNAAELVSFVDHLRHKSLSTINHWDKSFDFVCHSMGGLIFRAFLEAWTSANPAEPPPVGHVVFIATPHLGSLNAARSLISGDDPLLGGRKEMRKLARTFPSVYELLPKPGSNVMTVTNNGAPVDLFVERNWQTNTTSAVPAPGGFDVEQHHLDDARNFWHGLPLPMDPRFGLTAKKMLVVYGAKPESTLQAIKVDAERGNWYDFANATKASGDDVVLEDSAKLPNVASVAIHTDDISWINPIQRICAEVSLHSFLPALDEVQTIVSRFLQDDTQGHLILPLNIPPARYTP